MGTISTLGITPERLPILLAHMAGVTPKTGKQEPEHLTDRQALHFIRNNPDCSTSEMFKHVGWRNEKALNRLIVGGFITVTKEAGRQKTKLRAVK